MFRGERVWGDLEQSRHLNNTENILFPEGRQFIERMISRIRIYIVKDFPREFVGNASVNTAIKQK
jgi:hypothetical protein